MKNINWPFAIIVSVIIHVVILGVLVSTHTPTEDEVTTNDELRITNDETPAPSSKPASKAVDSVSSEGGGRKFSGDVMTELKKPGTGNASRSVEGIPSERTPEASVPRKISTSAEPSTTPEYYTIKSGDNLTMLAKRANLTTTELAALNGKTVKELSRLYIGQRIRIK